MKKSDMTFIFVVYVLCLILLYFVGRNEDLKQETARLESKIDSLNNELIINKLEMYYPDDHSSIK